MIVILWKISSQRPTPFNQDFLIVITNLFEWTLTNCTQTLWNQLLVYTKAWNTNQRKISIDTIIETDNAMRTLRNDNLTLYFLALFHLLFLDYYMFLLFIIVKQATRYSTYFIILYITNCMARSIKVDLFYFRRIFVWSLSSSSINIFIKLHKSIHKKIWERKLQSLLHSLYEAEWLGFT